MVVELCVARNRRNKSCSGYKGAANICYQRACKGFNVQLNPDRKWSCSPYKALDQLQNDGRYSLFSNHDDQAGFRLDTTYTHKACGSLNTKRTVTTGTDFLNKHQTLLPATSYNFSKTDTTNDVCVGVVKASSVHEKSLSQHMSDLEMLEFTANLRHVFKTVNSGKNKEVEYIQVDEAVDEGPSHVEVQFLWTERHHHQLTRVTFVTARASGDSFLNRVKLQNGCLARGHSNLFIPSTLNGSPIQFDKTDGIT